MIFSSLHVVLLLLPFLFLTYIIDTWRIYILSYAVGKFYEIKKVSSINSIESAVTCLLILYVVVVGFEVNFKNGKI